MARPNFDVYCSTQDPKDLALLTDWDTQEAMNDFLRSEAFRAVLPVVDRAIVAPEIRFESVAVSQGLEYLENVVAR